MKSKKLNYVVHTCIFRMFVVERQPNRIKKITQRKSLSNNMIVRFVMQTKNSSEQQNNNTTYVSDKPS